MQVTRSETSQPLPCVFLKSALYIVIKQKKNITWLDAAVGKIAA